MEKEILEILKRLEQGQKSSEQTQARFEESLKRLEQGQINLEARVDENTQILRVLEHSAEVNKSEHDKMANDIAKIQGDISAIKKDLSQVELVTANNWADIVKLKAIK